jgi:dihydrolipoamide dehydrogenase
VEFAYFYNSFGSKVTLVEMLPQILPVEDEEVAKTLAKSFEKQGVALHTNTKCENFRVGKNTVKVDLVAGDKKTEVEAEVLLSAIGVVANIEGVFAANLKPELDRNYLKVGDDYQSSVKGVYGAGDIIGPPWLAHVATFEALNAVNGMFGHGKPKRVKNFPGCTYCQPQVASTGLTEKAAKEAGYEVKVGKVPFMASGKASAAGATDGFVKVIFDAKYGEFLGAHMIGMGVTDMIAEVVVARKLETTYHEILNSVHPHPTMSEAVKEATAAAYGEAIDI